ncbi:MAG TPA: NAD(P)H-binding protein, partial [Actinomycetota bacterium]|nr:NAD(P)H-binding protein [Actinomycetota bacterium]
MRSMAAREKMAAMEILVTGAGGFVGAALAPELVARGHAVRAGTRDPGRRPAPAGTVAQHFDLDDEASLGPALDGVELAYYLVHSMAQKGEFARRDLHHARAFGRAARAAGVDRVVYLSGLGDEREGLSEHLASRRAVEDALASTGPELTVLRAAIVLGRGGASFEMLVQLVRRLPVMLCPRWVETASQPIALADTVGYLGDTAETEATRGQRLEIGGPEVLTYREMMLRFARLEGRRRLIVTVPLFSPGLSSRWIGLVTDVPAAVARPLAEGLRNRVVVSNGA